MVKEAVIGPIPYFWTSAQVSGRLNRLSVVFHVKVQFQRKVSVHLCNLTIDELSFLTDLCVKSRWRVAPSGSSEEG